MKSILIPHPSDDLPDRPQRASDLELMSARTRASARFGSAALGSAAVVEFTAEKNFSNPLRMLKERNVSLLKDTRPIPWSSLTRVKGNRNRSRRLSLMNENGKNNSTPGEQFNGHTDCGTFFNIKHAVLSSKLADLAYQDYGTEEFARLCHSANIYAPGYSVKHKNAQAYIFNEPEGIFLTFRGTEMGALDNIIDNFVFHQLVPFEENNGQQSGAGCFGCLPKMHSKEPVSVVSETPCIMGGYQRQWNLIMSQVIGIIATLWEKRSLLQHVQHFVYITGHSMGAAIAELAAVEIRKRFPAIPLRLYTFAAPTVGNRAFSTEIFEPLMGESRMELSEFVMQAEKMNCVHYRVTNDLDVATQYLWKRATGGKQNGYLVWFDELRFLLHPAVVKDPRRKAEGVPLIYLFNDEVFDDHKLTRYCAILSNLLLYDMLCELKEKRVFVEASGNGNANGEADGSVDWDALADEAKKLIVDLSLHTPHEDCGSLYSANERSFGADGCLSAEERRSAKELAARTTTCLMEDIANVLGVDVDSFFADVDKLFAEKVEVWESGDMSMQMPTHLLPETNEIEQGVKDIVHEMGIQRGMNDEEIDRDVEIIMETITEFGVNYTASGMQKLNTVFRV